MDRGFSRLSAGVYGIVSMDSVYNLKLMLRQPKLTEINLIPKKG